MAGSSLIYLSFTSIKSLPSTDFFSLPTKKPSLTKTLTNSDLNFEKGTSTDFLPLIKPFLILVKQSDIGS